MKKIFTLLLIVCTTLNLMAQTPGQPIGGIVVKGGKNPGGNLLVSGGVGFTSPSSKLKSENNLDNLTNYNLNLYVPLVLKHGGATGGVISFGFNAGAEYFTGNKDYNTANLQAYNITGQNGNPTVVAKGTGSPKQPGFKTEAGAQANFSFGEVTISPILNASYFNLKQKAFNITQTSAVNGKTTDYNLLSQSETKTNGFAFIPKLRLSYFPGALGFYVEANYTMGPTVKNETTNFKPSGNANAQGFYNIDQMLTGTNVVSTKSNQFNAFGINAGIQIALGKNATNKTAKRRVEVLKSNKTNEPEISNAQEQGTGGGKATMKEFTIIKKTDTATLGKNAETGSPNSDPQNIIYGGNPPPILLCARLFDINRNEIAIDGFVNMYLVYSISFLPCGGGSPNAFITLPPGSASVSNQTLVSTLAIKSKKPLAGKSVKIEKDIEITNSLAAKYGVENVFIKAGEYTFNHQNELPLNIAYGRRVEVLKSNKTETADGRTYTGGRKNDQQETNSAERLSMTPTTTKQSANFGEKVASGLQTGGSYAKETAPTKVKCNCGTDIYGKDEEACKRICQFLKDGTYSSLSTHFTPDELQEIKDKLIGKYLIEKNGIKELDPTMFKEVTKPSDLKGQKVSITKAGKSYAFLGNQDELVRVISIPTARAQECTDCNETDNCENSHHFDCCCNGGYCWCLICVEIVKMKDLPDGKVVPTGNGSTKQTQGQNFGERAIKPGNGGMADDLEEAKRQHQPWPGTHGVNKPQNSNGVSQGASLLGGALGGNKTITPNQPTEKGHSEKGIKRSEIQNLAAGQPIGGITVKVGKNPGGSLITITSNEKGEVEFKNLAPGDYKFALTVPPANEAVKSNGTISGSSGAVSSSYATGKIIAPNQPAEKGHSEKGIKRSETIVSNNEETDGSQTNDDTQQRHLKGKITWPGDGGTKTEMQNLSAGNPIRGIIVKGGKNPGGSIQNFVTNNNGEFEFKVKESGNYKFVITVPENPQGKSISEKGVSSTKGRGKKN